MATTLIKEWLTTKEAEELTGYDRRKFTKQIRAGKIDRYKKEGSNYLIHRDVIAYFVDINKDYLDNYYPNRIVAQKLGKEVSAITDMIYRKVFKDIKKWGMITYISKVEVEKYLELKTETFTTPEVTNITGLSGYAIGCLIKDGLLEAVQVNHYLWFIYKNSLDNFLKEISEGFTLQEISEHLKLDEFDINRYKTIGWLKVFEIKGYGFRVRKVDIENFLQKKKEFYTVQDICKEFNLKAGVVRQTIIGRGLVEAYLENEKYYVVPKNEMIRLMGTPEGVKLLFFAKHDYNEFFKKFIDALLNTVRYKDTFILFRQWANDKIVKSKAHNKKRMVNYFVLTSEKLSIQLSKEIYNYSNDEMNKLINRNDFTSKDIEIIVNFLSFCKRKRVCEFKIDFTINNVSDTKQPIDKKIYSKEEWVHYCTYLTNIDIHKEKAITSRRYAETWLFILLHLSLSWRSSDIIKMPHVHLESVGINDFEWFKENDFYLEIAQKIINDIRRRSIGIKTNKTGINTHFVIGLVMPTALAFAICELHSRKILDKDKFLFSVKSFRDTDYKRVLGDNNPKFSSLKCNRTLMTYQFETAANKEGKAHIAYQLCSYARSHKPYLDRQNDITSVYLITSNTDLSVDNISLHLFERGFFGWQLGLMLNLIYNNSDWSIQNKTDMIKAVSKDMSPIMTESISEYVYTRHEETEELFRELMLLPKEKIRSRLIEISQFKSPSMLDYSQCLKGIKNCNYKKTIACLGCKYLIPTNYMLEMVNIRLFSLLKKMDETSVSEKTKRIKYSHMINQLMFILMDFKRAYKVFDKNYLDSFVDLKKLKDTYERLERDKFLSVSGEIIEN